MVQVTALRRHLSPLWGRISPGGLVFALVAALLALVWALALWQMRAQYLTFAAARAQVNDNVAVDHLLAAGRSLVLERDRVSVRLAAAEPAEEASRAFIRHRRQEQAEHLDPALAALPRDLAGAIGLYRQTLNDRRRVVDGQLALPLERRDALVLRQWHRDAVTLFDALQGAARGLALADNRHMPAFRVLIRVKLTALDLREALGEETSRIGARLAGGGGFDAASRNGLARLRGRADSLLATIGHDVAVSGNPILAAAMAAVEEKLGARLRPAQDRLLEAAAGQASALSATAYSTVAGPALEEVVRLMDTVQAQT